MFSSVCKEYCNNYWLSNYIMAYHKYTKKISDQFYRRRKRVED